MRKTSFVVAAALVAGALTVPQAEAAPQPLTLTCGTQIVQPGSYRATNSVHNCGNAVIVDITVANVTLDLNEHMVDGEDLNCVKGITVAPGITNARILNGTVRDCDTGVDADNSGSGVVVKNMVAFSNSLAGILLEDDASAINNLATGNGTYGIRGDANNTFRGNTVTGNASGLRGSTGNTVTANTLTGNGDGIFVTENNVVTNNVVRNNGDGIDVGNNSRVIENTVTTTGGAGISGDDGLVARRNVVKKNRFDGIFANADAVVIGNIASENGSDGISLASSPATVKNNTAVGNVGWGIIAVTPVTGNGTNTAKKNGEPDQCDPTSLC